MDNKINSNSEYPKILFLTVNGWNNTTGTATISSMIDGYPSENIANIFIRADLPNSKCSSKYFRIPEFDVFKSILKRKFNVGYEVNVSETTSNDVYTKERSTHSFLKKFSNVTVSIIREFMWKAGKWKSESLNEFVSDFKPDVVIFPAEALIHFNNIGRYVAKIANCPYGLFFWDDNFTYKPVNGLLKKLYRFFQRRNIKKNASEAKFGFSLNPKMRFEVKEDLGLDTVLLTKPMARSDYSEKRTGEIIKILYTGSLYIDRDKTILKVIDAIKNINQYKPSFFLDIYTNSELSEAKKRKFNIDGVCQLHPGVTKEKVIELQRNYDILLFVEALEGKFKNSARLSFSTKLVDYFSSGRCIFTVAPSDIAPTEYLRDNDIAVVASNQDEVIEKLYFIANNISVVDCYGKKAFEFGNENHNKKNIEKLFKEEVITIYTENVKNKEYKPIREETTQC